MIWANIYGDVVDEQGREDFISEEMTNDEDASGISNDRANAERVFNNQHTLLDTSDQRGNPA